MDLGRSDTTVLNKALTLVPSFADNSTNIAFSSAALFWPSSVEITLRIQSKKSIHLESCKSDLFPTRITRQSFRWFATSWYQCNTLSNVLRSVQSVGEGAHLTHRTQSRQRLNHGYRMEWGSESVCGYIPWYILLLSSRVPQLETDSPAFHHDRFGEEVDSNRWLE